ncbi:hypothetical protein BKA58DRAFT_123723 [Alternaria rosae]|uniref:uncharacterized protein n=1 Tax=Alternaria rosae TaxID=1187941 RepID=UPI001E8D5A6C|nr:uncharacterized protein BKA58DRAFT_123723 [Alternaria rosae]KAH6875539.1 hypothetical protein BKA58DRAFT_123723 [Alternaria rosae]
MIPCTAPVEPHINPPPIPVRSQLRNGSAYQQRLRAIISEPMSATSVSSSPASRTLFDELDRELTETQQRLASVSLEGRDMSDNRESLLWDDWRESDTSTERGLKSDSGGASEDCCLSELKSEASDGDNYPEPLRPSERSGHVVEQIDVQRRVPAQRGSRDSPPSAIHTNHTTRSDHSSSSSDYSSRTMDTKVSDWLAQGFRFSESHESDSPRQVTSNSDRPFPPRLAALSLFPPTSPSTGNKEYTPPGSPFARPACPVSPLNNGRDVYGNYIPSNMKDYFAPQSPPMSPNIRAIPESRVSLEHGRSSPIVHLRGGGWNLKGLWKTSDTGGSDQNPGSTSMHHLTGKDAIVRELPTTDHAGRPESRAARSVRSHFSTTRDGNDTRTAQGTPARPSPIDTRRYGQHPNGGGDIRLGSNTPDSADTDDSSVPRARADAVLYQYFGSQLSPRVPKSPEITSSTVRAHQTTHNGADVKVKDGHRLPPIDRTLAQPNSQSALSSQDDHTRDSTSPSRPETKTIHRPWDTVRSEEAPNTDDTAQSHVFSPRDKKRWDRNNPPPPPRLPPPNPPRYLRTDLPDDDASEYTDDSHQASSVVSANTRHDQLIDLLDIGQTDVYRRVEREREIRRIQAQRKWHDEADRRRHVDIRRQQGSREPDLDTILPDDSIAALMRRQQTERRHDLERPAAVQEYRPTSSPAPSQYLPRHGPITTKTQAIPQQQSNRIHTIGYPSVVPAPAAFEPASIKRKHSLQTVLSKAGKLTRLILAAPSDPKYKTYSQRQHPVKQSGMSADATGWPRNGKASSANHGMFMSTQAPQQRTMFSRDRPQTSGDDAKRSGSRGWEHPRGRRAKKVEKAESKRRRGRWGRKTDEETSTGDTQVIDFASRDAARSKGATRLQHPPRARPPSPKALTRAAEPPVPVFKPSTYHQQEPTFMPSDVAGTPQTRFGPPDREGKLYVRRRDGEVLPFNPALGYPYHLRLNTYYDHKTVDATTMAWLEGIRAQTDAIPHPVINMRGGDGSISSKLRSTYGEASSLASRHHLLTSAVMSLDSGNETVGGTDTDALLVSSTHLSLGQVTHEAIAAVNGAHGDEGNNRPSCDEAHMRSSFSTDSTVELRREKKDKASAWRNEDQARAMAIAMHGFG